MAPALFEGAGLSLKVPVDLDTDSLGTFTGDVPRPAPMRETARMKALMGMKAAGLTLGIASEGSFGPHPALPFAAAGHEMMLFIDAEQGLEIAEAQMSENTNFAALDIAPETDLDGFLHRTGFPAHALMLRAGRSVTKGITSRSLLERAIAKGEGPLRLETDMRAHMNPTRMAELAKLAAKLARRIATPCPACGAPGFGTTRSEPGLPCADCGAETQLVRSLIESCARCGHARAMPRSDGRTTATPAECPECNP